MKDDGYFADYNDIQEYFKNNKDVVPYIIIFGKK